MSAIDRFRADDESRQAVDRAAFLPHHDMRISQCTTIEQVRCDYSVAPSSGSPLMSS